MALLIPRKTAKHAKGSRGASTGSAPGLPGSVSESLLRPDKLNVLVLGAPGSGKSTLIQAIAPYAGEDSPLVLVDAPKSSAERKLLRKEPVQAIWYCLDGMQHAILQDDLDGLRAAVKQWPDVPLIAVFTHSLGTDERDLQNITMLQDAFDAYKRQKDLGLRTKDIIPVLAQEFETPLGILPVRGLDRLVERTREVVASAELEASDRKVRAVVHDLKRKEANAAVAASAALAATIGAVPVSFPDATLLVPLQTAMLAKIARLYDLKDKSAASQISEAALKAGATTIVGRSLLVAVKGIPVVGTIGGSVLNAAVAAIVTSAVGESSVIVYDKIAKGELVLDETTDLGRLVTEVFAGRLPDIVSVVAKAFAGKKASEIPKDLAKMVYKMVIKDK